MALRAVECAAWSCKAARWKVCIQPSPRAAQNRAAFTLTGGVGYVPITFGDLSAPRGSELLFDGVKLDQSVHGNDFWQADFDAKSQRWSLTFNVPIHDDKPHSLRFTINP